MNKERFLKAINKWRKFDKGGMLQRAKMIKIKLETKTNY